MAKVQHAALTGADLHEPKAVAAANAGEVYLTDGAASGTMTDVETLGPTTRYAETFMNSNATETTINTTNVYENVAGTASDGEASGLTISNGVFTAVVAGVYKFDGTISMEAASNNQILQFDFGVDTGAGFVAHNEGPPRRLIQTGADVGALSLQMILTLAVDDDVRLLIRNKSSNANVTVTDLNCVGFMIEAV